MVRMCKFQRRSLWKSRIELDWLNKKLSPPGPEVRALPTGLWPEIISATCKDNTVCYLRSIPGLRVRPESDKYLLVPQ